MNYLIKFDLINLFFFSEIFFSKKMAELSRELSEITKDLDSLILNKEIKQKANKQNERYLSKESDDLAKVPAFTCYQKNTQVIFLKYIYGTENYNKMMSETVSVQTRYS